MRNRTRHLRWIWLAVLLLALCEAACSWIWPRDHENEKRRCPCADDSICLRGLCWPRDGRLDGSLDGALADASRDDGAADAVRDSARRDAAPGDAAHDGPRLDKRIAADVGPSHDAASHDAWPQCSDAGSGSPPGCWVLIPKGSFTMGSPSDEACREPGESDTETQHAVTLTHDFEMQTTEVTRGQLHAVLGFSPPWMGPLSCSDDACPAAGVFWSAAASYCNALSGTRYAKCYECSGSGLNVSCSVASAYNTAKSTIYQCPGYRLPTEAEWEYAYRAGSQKAFYPTGSYTGGNSGQACRACTPFEANADAIAWYRCNAAESSTSSNYLARSVGTKAANAWGLYDMAGNVWEWCHDDWIAALGSGSQLDPVATTTLMPPQYVVRGGSFYSDAEQLRAAARRSEGNTADDIGFRCVRTLPH